MTDKIQVAGLKTQDTVSSIKDLTVERRFTQVMQDSTQTLLQVEEYLSTYQPQIRQTITAER